MSKWMKIICLSLASSFLFVILSCSTTDQILSWSKPLTSKDKNSAQFFSTMRSHPGNPDSHYLLACYYQERGRHKEAIEEFNKVLLIDPGNIKAYNGIGVSSDLLRDFSGAIEHYHHALKLNPNLGYVHNNLGYSYLLQGNLDEAITSLKRAISLNDKDTRFHNNLGLAYGEKGEYDLALAEFKLAGDEAEAYFNIAQLYFKKGLFDDAKSHYAIAMKSNPASTVVRTGLKAADALARIFIPTDIKGEQKALAMADQPAITKEEVEKIVTADQSPELKSEPEESVTSISVTTVNSETEESMALDELYAKNQGAEESITSQLDDTSVDNSISQEKILKDIEDLYQLQVASFRSRENAILAARSIQKLGFETEILSWGNGNKDKWYRLIMGPFETMDQASSYKVKIEKEYSFSPMLRKAAVGKAEAKGILAPEQISEEETLAYLKNIDVEISNGNGVYRMARKVGNYLKEKGVKVTRLTNANNFKHPETSILYQKEYDEAADHIAEYLPVFRSKEKTEKFDRPNIKIKILIGKDLILHQKAFENGKGS